MTEDANAPNPHPLDGPWCPLRPETNRQHGGAVPSVTRIHEFPGCVAEGRRNRRPRSSPGRRLQEAEG